MIKGFHHTGFVGADLETAVTFYRDVVGLEEQGRYERIGEGIQQVVGYDDAHLQIALMGAGGQHNLELIQYLSPSSAQRPTNERSVQGATHLCIQVDDIETIFETLMSNGAKKLNPPKELAPGRTACYLQDPDGNWLELLQLDS